MWEEYLFLNIEEEMSASKLSVSVNVINLFYPERPVREIEK